MCMIAYRPILDGKAGTIPNNVIDAAMSRHPDGFGVAWRELDAADNVVLRTARFGPAQRKAFRRALKRIDRTGTEYVAHFRFATHGPKAASHAHPYTYMDPAEGEVLVFHNGVISIGTTPAESDTEVFVRDVLARMPTRWWANPALRWLVGESIGWSRLVLMTTTETVNLQEDDGEWDGGLWYSSNHKPYAPTTSTVYKYTGTGYTAYQPGWESTADKYKAQTDGATAQGTAKPETALTVVTSDSVISARDIDRPYKFRHGGHNLSALKDIDRTVDGDWEQSVVCDECFTLGDVYCIDGQTYIDMGHNAPTVDDDGENLLRDMDDLLESGDGEFARVVARQQRKRDKRNERRATLAVH